MTKKTAFFLLLPLLFPLHALADSISFNIVDRKSTRQCYFIGRTTIEVAYFLKNQETARVYIMTTENKQTWRSVKSFSVTKGKGNRMVTFDAGPCTRKINVQFSN